MRSTWRLIIILKIIYQVIFCLVNRQNKVKPGGKWKKRFYYCAFLFIKISGEHMCNNQQTIFMGWKRKQPEFLVSLGIWDVRSSIDQTDSVIFSVCSQCVEWCNKQLRNCKYYFVLRMTNFNFNYFFLAKNVLPNGL